MGRAMRWLKKLLTGAKEGHGGVKADWHDAAEKETSRWSFVKQRKSGADGGKPRPSVVALAAAVRPCRCVGEPREEEAAVVVQKAFRGYLARKALRALRSLVKLQALVRGYLVRRQAATTLRRLQALMRLQADSHAVKQASYRRSMEQERIVTEDVRTKPSPSPAKAAHRRRLSDSTDSNYERSPRIVEMDTCHLRSRSTRIASGRYTPDRSSARLAADLAPLSVKQPQRLSTRRHHEREPVRHARTAQNTPRFSGPDPPYAYDSPAKSVDGLTPRPLWHRDLLASPRYMGGTASSAAKTRCHSAPRQPAEAARASLTAQAGSRRSASKRMQGGYLSEATLKGYSGLIEEEARDYYLDRMW
ncbi:hypothetical protein QYE76_055316 [Lolium multiflorum]|uniref:DUF4005 domain-containing protein n=1 Tax=Lolium multiflorum TaxID=4521 RepID=A0AAD8T075_LOLMU|nr:hypothetical protein QYE76_055316 [Lolium multiflorum]